MAYAPKDRPFYDADSHIMELPDFITSYTDPSIRNEIPPVRYGASIVTDEEVAKIMDQGGLHSEEHVLAQIAMGDELIANSKEIQALGAFNSGERSKALDLLGFKKQLVFATHSVAVPFHPSSKKSVAWRYGAARGHNRHMVDFCANDHRLMGVAVIPLDDHTTRDSRHVLIVLQNINRDLPKLVSALDIPDLLDGKELSVVELFRDKLNAKRKIASAFAQQDLDNICPQLEKAGIVFSPVYRNSEVIEDKQLQINDVFIPFKSGKPGCESTISNPFKLNGEQQLSPRAAPGIGEHSIKVLTEFGISTNAIELMKEKGVIHQKTTNSSLENAKKAT